MGKLSGVDIPICAVHHEYLVTATLPEVAELKRELPVVRDMDGSYYCRQERSGLLVGPYETADRMKIMEDWYDSGPPKSKSRRQESYSSFPCYTLKEIQTIRTFPRKSESSDLGFIIVVRIAWTSCWELLLYS